MQPPHVPSPKLVEGSEVSSPNSAGLDVDFEDMEKFSRLGFSIVSALIYIHEGSLIVDGWRSYHFKMLMFSSQEGISNFGNPLASWNCSTSGNINEQIGPLQSTFQNVGTL
ncbi:unnamed protein product [Lupinus luteus]|uniref:Uncharacterized protein n=1 Tax=Lupinus luteus TaxID=3873 RepID=A0AAV1WEU0_LUPLU